MISVGIDIGSVAAKAVVFDHALGVQLSESILPTGWNHKRVLEDIQTMVLEQAGIDYAAVCAKGLTGYGRVVAKGSIHTVSEIACHAAGAHFLFPDGHGVIDIGGQDSKGILLGPGGSVTDFLMNDKCAAGTGRFISMVAMTLGVDLEGFARLSAKGTAISVNSMCAVFAESEIVGLLARGAKPEDVAAGVSISVARRTAGLAARLGLTGRPCIFTGGLAQNPLITAELGNSLRADIRVPDSPQFVGALGAALLAKAFFHPDR